MSDIKQVYLWEDERMFRMAMYAMMLEVSANSKVLIEIVSLIASEQRSSIPSEALQQISVLVDRQRILISDYLVSKAKEQQFLDETDISDLNP
jgi:hypothetical protein